MIERHRYINWVALALALIWLGLIGATVTPNIEDFEQYWQASLNVRTVGDPYATTPEHGGEHTNAAPFPYPPLLAYLMLPFSWLDATWALWLWFGCNLALLGILTLICIRISQSRLAQQYWGVVAFGMAIAPPTRLSLQLGQVSVLLTLLMIGGFGLAQRRTRLAGFSMALATLIKLYPGFLGLFYMRCGPRRVAWWSVGSGLAIGALSLLLHGPVPYGTYLRKVLLGGFYPYAAEFNISLVGYWQRLLVPNAFAAAPLHMPGLAWGLAGFTSLVVLLGCLGSGGQAEHGLSLVLRFCVYLCGMLLIAPVNGYYNLIALLLPILAVLRVLELRPDRTIRAVLVFAGALICIPAGWSAGTPLYNVVHTGWGILLLSPALYGVVVLFGLLVVLARQPIVGGIGQSA
jgi:hypothetical protein